MGTIMERKNLKEARRRRNWSQDRLAELMETRRETISDWERGVKSPDFYNREQLARLFRCTSPEELETLLMLVPDPKEETSSSALLLPDFVRRNLSTSLLCIAHTSYRAPSEMTTAIQAVIEDFDMMNMGDAAYPLTRREALLSLAALPMTTLGQKPALHTKHYDEMLMHCNAALEACWQLYRSSDPTGTQHAFDCCCTYVPLLESIAHDSSQHHKEALDLATQYAILQTMLGWDNGFPWEAIPYAQKALFLSKASGNILLQISAYPKFSRTLRLSGNSTEAQNIMLEGEHTLRSYAHTKKHAPIPSGIIGNFYVTYSIAQATSGIDPDATLGIASDCEPLDGQIAFVEFTASHQWMQLARAYNTKGDSKQAMLYLEKLMDLETFVPSSGLHNSERGRLGAINQLTLALLQSKERDMEKVIKTWTAAIEGAQVIRSEELYRDALTNFAILKALYPGEQRIMKLIPLTSHW